MRNGQRGGPERFKQTSAKDHTAPGARLAVGAESLGKWAQSSQAGCFAGADHGAFEVLQNATAAPLPLLPSPCCHTEPYATPTNVGLRAGQLRAAAAHSRLGIDLEVKGLLDVDRKVVVACWHQGAGEKFQMHTIEGGGQERGIGERARRVRDHLLPKHHVLPCAVLRVASGFSCTSPCAVHLQPRLPLVCATWGIAPR